MAGENFLERESPTLMISETKINDSFPVGNFIIEGFISPYRLDRDINGDGITLEVREDKIT